MNIVIETKGLTKKFKDMAALSSINFFLKEGSICGLIGNNGAGKTTLLKLLCGMAKTTSGTIAYYCNGSEVKNKIYFAQIGTLIEAPGIMLNMSALDNLKAKSLCMKGRYSKEDIEELLELVGLQHVKEKKAKEFSLGMKQRLGIALALVGNPKLLILDEPINGLDPEGIMKIRNLLIRLNREKKMTIIVSSHLLDELAKIATDFCIIDKGHIVLQSTKEEFIEQCGDKKIDEYYLQLVGGVQ